MWNCIKELQEIKFGAFYQKSSRHDSKQTFALCYVCWILYIPFLLLRRRCVCDVAAMVSSAESPQPRARLSVAGAAAGLQNRGWPIVRVVRFHLMCDSMYYFFYHREAYTSWLAYVIYHIGHTHTSVTFWKSNRLLSTLNRWYGIGQASLFICKIMS